MRFVHILRDWPASSAAALAIGFAVAVSSANAVRAEHADPQKKPKPCDTSSYCIEYDNTGAGGGPEATSTSGTGVVGITSASNGDSGVSGIQNGTYGEGVYGRSSGGSGVYGQSSLQGASGVYGVMKGTSNNNGNGVTAESADSTGFYNALYAQGDSADTFLLYAYNTFTNGNCYIDPSADLACTGSGEFAGGTSSVRRQAGTGRRVVAYASEAPSATIEDTGTASLVNGVALVPLERDYGATIDRSQYRVFVTPDGDASLYVAQKTPNGFIVRETHGGRSSLSFDYRIVARPLDAKPDRLPPAPAMRKPSLAVHR
jgi:hypothetical protein